MKTNHSNGWTSRYALLALVVWAPLGLGAKGCDHAVVGDDGHCTTDCPSGEAGADTGGTAGTGGDAGKGGTGTSGDAGKGGTSGTSGTAGKGGSSATGGSSGSVGQGGSSGTTTCGGLQGLSCGKGEYCDFTLEAMCGAADQTGTCQPMADVCDTLYAPVCGCDGQTYGNDCEAARAGVAVSATGACEPTGVECGGRIGDVCSEGEFCDYPADAICGRGDATGTCQPKPEGCTTEYAPVCGCDGQTYGNACTAQMVGGVSVDHNGLCATFGPACGGLEGTQCPAEEFCEFGVFAECGAADHTGTCQQYPAACDDAYAPVCGCDGKTYPSACYAQQAGVSLKYTGTCP